MVGFGPRDFLRHVGRLSPGRPLKRGGRVSRLKKLRTKGGDAMLVFLLLMGAIILAATGHLILR